MGYIFYRIVLLNGVNKNVYKKENSIKLYCKLNGKMIDIKKYKQLCKVPKKSKAKSKTKSKTKAKAKDKKKYRRKNKMKGGFIIDFFKKLFNGKTKNEKDLEEAYKKYDKLKNEGEKICSDANKKTQDAQKEVFRLEVVVNHEKEQKKLKENATNTQNQQQQHTDQHVHQEPNTQTQGRDQEQQQSMMPNRNSPLKNTSTTEVYNAKGGKAKKRVKKNKKNK